MTPALFPVVILAGGLATRLRPLTETIPKALIEINGEPFIAHQLRLLRKNNITQVVLCLGFLGEQITEYVGDGSRFELNVSYVFDGPTLLGTAGAIKQALPLLKDDFFVLYGDSYLPCDYLAVQQAFIESQQPALMTVFENNSLWDTSNVEFAQQTIVSYNKIHRTQRMRYIDYGLGVFNRLAFDQIPANHPYDLALLYQDLLKRQQLAAFEIKQRFYEIGSFTGIEELGQYLAAI